MTLQPAKFYYHCFGTLSDLEAVQEYDVRGESTILHEYESVLLCIAGEKTAHWLYLSDIISWSIFRQLVLPHMYMDFKNVIKLKWRHVYILWNIYQFVEDLSHYSSKR